MHGRGESVSHARSRLRMNTSKKGSWAILFQTPGGCACPHAFVHRTNVEMTCGAPTDQAIICLRDAEHVRHSQVPHFANVTLIIVAAFNPLHFLLFLCRKTTQQTVTGRDAASICM